MILDTNALSAMAEGDAGLERRLGRTPILSLPVIVLGEFRYGVRTSQQSARYEDWLSERLPLFDVLSVDAATAEMYAEVRAELKAAGRPIPPNDLWIAALARQYELPLVTRDQHFAAVAKIEVVSW